MMDYCLFACSDQFNISNKALEFIGISEDITKLLGINLTRIDYSFDEDAATDNPPSREEPYYPKRKQSLAKELTAGTLSELALWSLQREPGEYESENFASKLLDSGLPQGYKYVSIYFPMDLIEGWSKTKVFQFSADLLSTLCRLVMLDYALITTMEFPLPSTYFRGIFTSGLRKEEALNLATWERKYVERKVRARGIYWGNYLSANHLSRIQDQAKFLGELEESIDGYHTPIGSGDLFFMLPSDRPPLKISQSVERLFVREDLLILPDERATQIVKNLLVKLR